MKTLAKADIKRLLVDLPLLENIEQGFVQYSKGLANIPPVGELLLEKGEVHIKYGAIKGGDYYVVKVASGFYGNASLDLPTSGGVMLLFSQKTGQLVCSLFDEGMLTDIRTAVAGAIVAKHLAPENVEAIGVVGTGIQARLQAKYLKAVTSCRRVIVWGRSSVAVAKYQQSMVKHGLQVEAAHSISELCDVANLIVTTTASTEALLQRSDIRAGTHITAIGSDTSEKQELSSDIFDRADRVVVDSLTQSQHRGEVFKARQSGNLKHLEVEELGNVIATGKTRDDQSHITVADLTGVAVQDIKIAESVYLAAMNSRDM